MVCNPFCSLPLKVGFTLESSKELFKDTDICAPSKTIKLDPLWWGLASVLLNDVSVDSSIEPKLISTVLYSYFTGLVRDECEVGRTCM